MLWMILTISSGVKLQPSIACFAARINWSRFADQCSTDTKGWSNILQFIVREQLTGSSRWFHDSVQQKYIWSCSCWTVAGSYEANYCVSSPRTSSFNPNALCSVRFPNCSLGHPQGLFCQWLCSKICRKVLQAQFCRLP